MGPQDTLSQWSGTVEPPTASFEGRLVEEELGSTTWDYCHDPAVALNQVPTCSHFSFGQFGGTSTVDGANLWQPDTFGLADQCVTEYRTFGVSPCAFGMDQSMDMYCRETPTKYAEGPLEYMIDMTTVGATRMFSATEVLIWP